MTLARWTTLLAMLGGIILLAAAGIVLISVLLRAFANGQVSGDFEIVQVATVFAAFAFLPFCQMRRGNILVDTFTARWPKRVQRGLDALWDLVYAGMAGVITVQLAQGAYEAVHSNTVSMVLGLPFGWTIAACSAMAFLLTVTAVVTAIRLLRGQT
jgi:TRAP-type C4-dicarboxylate transport system permease small subunit